jgi:hypothetical protein
VITSVAALISIAPSFTNTSPEPSALHVSNKLVVEIAVPSA